MINLIIDGTGRSKMAIKNQQQTEDAQQLFLTATVSHEDLGMTTGQNVAAHRRRLRSELRNERKLAHLTQKEVARAMDWSPSKMLRIETGSNGISVTDLRALLSYYNLKDKRRIEDLINLARAAKSGAVRDETFAGCSDQTVSPVRRSSNSR